MTRLRVRMSAAARADVDSIAAWIAEQSGSVQTAMQWLVALDDYLDMLARVPRSGTSQSDLRPGLRSSPFFNYLVFFKSSRTTLTVVRVIHGARNYARLFEDD